MKKIAAALLAAALMLSLASCGKNNTEKETSAGGAVTTTPSTGKAAYTLGLGVETSTASSKEAKAQVDASFAAVILDENGKIISCRVDCAQNKMTLTDGKTEKSAEYKTKTEQGEDYGMKSASGISKEWYEQAAAFEKYVTGKTQSEVEKIAVGDDGKTTDTDLLAGCTISVSDLIKACVKACGDSAAVKFTGSAAPKLSISAVTEDSATKDASEGADGVAAMYTTFAAAVTEDDKILASVIDEIQPKIAFDVKGNIGEITYKGTKREQGEGYGMKAASGIGKEWYEQAADFCGYTVGMKADEVKKIATDSENKATDADLLAGCTISVSPLIEALSKAVG